MPDLTRLENAKDPFELFDLPRKFDLDPKALEAKYLDLTRATHPDFAGADPEKQMAAMELSARVNDAHKLLADDEARANHLLNLLGGPDKEEDKSLPPGFLQKMLMVREEMEEAQQSGDAAALAAFENQAKQERAALLKTIATLFTALDAADPEPVKVQRRTQIRTQLNALRYIERMLEQVHPTGKTGL
jgi:molecular chaperone HscB